MVGERIAIEFRRRSIPKTFDVVPDVQPAKYLFWVNNHRIEQRRITSASPRTTDILAKKVWLALQNGSELALVR